MNHARSQRNNAAAFAAIAVLALTVGAAPSWAQRGSGGGFGRGDDDSITTSGASRNLQASITTDRSQYGPGRAVSIRLNLTNIGQRRVTLTGGSRGEYDIWVRDARTGNAVWQWSRSRGAGGGDRSRRVPSLEPGETRSVRELWDQTDDRGRPVPAGVYRIEARIWLQNPVSTQVYLTDRRGGGDDRDDRPFPGRPGDNIPRPWPGRDNDDRGGESASMLRSELRVDDAEVRAGDRVSFTYTVTNTGSRPRTLRFSSGRQFDAIVRAADRGGRDRFVWQLTENRRYFQALTEWTLRPGERKTFTETWQTRRDLPEGRYELTAFLTPTGARDGEFLGTRVTIRVSAPRTGGRVDRPGGGYGRDDDDGGLRSRNGGLGGR
jgi:hypothetical protein